ncbi:hypothetical protein BZG73_08160 [Salinivibrio siamensis]|uniref:DUF1415 domain-containing protein n=1 Tax=Salinivibrio siamensis TaxID=414286 RepID=A0ABX3K9S2_9GAMM|nr:DUF1415 domain-containing protein [Salinivibrio siamensis]OOE85591.1 hypothetical protein BZG73_08160 [Salinivibrio siamensis]
MNTVETHINAWLDDAVIGLNLCPFAAKPRRKQQIHIDICDAQDDTEILTAIYQALVHLDHTDPGITDTTVVVVPNALANFDHYLDLVDATEAMIDHYHWRGIFQVASFHPDYCFEGCAPEDSENLTNRSPYPCFHLIREASMSRALAHYGQDPEQIPARNIVRVSALTHEERQALFPWVKASSD